MPHAGDLDSAFEQLEVLFVSADCNGGSFVLLDGPGNNISKLRHRLEKTARTLVANGAGAFKYLGGAFAGFEIGHLRLRWPSLKTTNQKHHRRKQNQSRYAKNEVEAALSL